ncbi:MAG TPA: hypothetical protein PKN45_10890, partial [Candidatus Limiplasma sp.]|nr:hypothetical protein [Candidatus Limiplasma sp.]
MDDMTLEQLQIVVTASAEDAIAQLDAVHERVLALNGLSNQTTNVNVGTGQTKENLNGIATSAKNAEQGVTGAGKAADAAAPKVRQVGDEASASGGKFRLFGDSARTGGQNATIAFVAVAAAAKTAFDGITSSVTNGISAIQQYQAAMIGLNSVAQGKGIGEAELQAATGKVVDAFFDASSAATAFKNLLTRGFSLDQATNAILRLKDSAAFGRQSSLGFAQSIVSATEGLRNENSILVDNAGVTKNVAKMWEEYAKARGVATTSLTQAQKVEAEYQGIMQETTLQVGDFSKMTNTLAGAQANAAQQSLLASQSFGDAMTPLVGAGEQVKTGLLTALRETVETFPALAAGATTAAASFTGLVAVMAALKTAIDLIGKSSVITSLLSPLGKVAAVIGVVATLYTAVKKGVEAAAEAEEERKQANIEAANSAKSNVDSLNNLVARYKELASSSALTLDEQLELKELQEKLRTDYGYTGESIDQLSGKYDNLTEAIKTAREEAEKKSVDSLTQVTADKQKTALDDTQKMYQSAADAYKDYVKAQQEYADISTSLNSGDLTSFERNNLQNQQDAAKIALDDAKSQWETAKAPLEQASNDFLNWFLALTEQNAASVEATGGTWNKSLAEALANMFTFDAGDLSSQESEDSAKNYGQSFVYTAANALMEAVSSPEVATALTAAQDFHKKLADGYEPTEEEYNTIVKSYDKLKTAIAKALSSLTGKDVKADSADVASFMSSIGVPEAVANGWDQFGDAIRAAKLKDAKKQLDDITTSLKKQQNELNDGSAMAKHIQGWKQALVAYNNAKAGTAAQTAAFKVLEQEAAALGLKVTNSADDIEQTNNAINGMAGSIDSWSTTAINGLVTLRDQLIQVQANSVVNGKVTVDTSVAVKALNGLIALWNTVRTMLGLKPIKTDSSSHSGGGHSSTPATTTTQTDTAYEKAIDALEHLKSMGQETLEQELAYLQNINRQAAKYNLTTEERLNLEERIHAVQESIADRDKEDLDTLANGVVSALQSRYESMRDQETEALDKSRKAWEDWRDSNVSAIQAQIDALDELSSAEDRESEDAEKKRKIANLQQQLQYEQDSYNRAKLQQQLSDAQDSYSDWLKKNARDDQKTALEKQIDAINARADTELSKLDDQQQAIEDAYAARLQTASLEAEAEKILMSNTQQQIIALINQYAPDYNATGQNLGEQLYQGFLGRVGNIAN